MATAIDDVECKNPNCATGEFTPTRSDQAFCDQRCKNHYHNSKRKKLAQTVFAKQKKILHNYKVLAKLFNDPLYKNGVSEIILEHEKFDFTSFTSQSIKNDSNRAVLWSHTYGIELISETPLTYKIHHLK